MVSFDATAISRATPEQAWAAWVDVTSWAQADHMEFAGLDGEFKVGGVITTKAKGFPRSTLTITRVEEPFVWVDESRSPGLRMTFEHVIEAGDTGTTLTERALISGPLARPVGALMRKRLQALLSTSVTHLAQTAARASGAA